MSTGTWAVGPSTSAVVGLAEAVLPRAFGEVVTLARADGQQFAREPGLEAAERRVSLVEPRVLKDGPADTGGVGFAALARPEIDHDDALPVVQPAHDHGP